MEFVENRQAFFAKRIHHSFSGLGMHDWSELREEGVIEGTDE